MAETRRLYRSRTDKQIAGVSGGLGKYLDIDPTIIRLAFVALMVVGGQGLLLYLILAIVIPEEPIDYTYPSKRKRDEAFDFEEGDSPDNGSGTV
jgi:phage shock protein PspC (stress-responsive transcriptional regulator)